MTSPASRTPADPGPPAGSPGADRTQTLSQLTETDQASVTSLLQSDSSLDDFSRDAIRQEFSGKPMSFWLNRPPVDPFAESLTQGPAESRMASSEESPWQGTVTF